MAARQWICSGQCGGFRSCTSHLNLPPPQLGHLRGRSSLSEWAGCLNPLAFLPSVSINPTHGQVRGPSEPRR